MKNKNKNKLNMSGTSFLQTNSGYKLYNAPAASASSEGLASDYETEVYKFCQDGFTEFAKENFYTPQPPANTNCIVSLKLIQYSPAPEEDRKIVKSIGKPSFYYGQINGLDVQILGGNKPSRKPRLA